MAKLILYSYYRSSASYRVRIALNLKNIPHEIRPVHLLKNGGEQHRQNYAELNPAEQVPTLVDGDFVLSESMAILDYLENKFGGPSLFPREPRMRAQVIRFCEVINSGIQPLGNLKVTQYLEKRFPSELKLRDEWIQNWVGKGLSVVENLLTRYSGTYSFGGEVTAADVLLAPQVFTSNRFNVSLNDFPNIVRVNENLSKIGAFALAHPSQQVDAE